MAIEYEAMFGNIDRILMRQRLTEVGARLVRPEFLQRRYNLTLPGKETIEFEWLRLRDEGDKITLSLKADKAGGAITDQHELCVTISDLEIGRQMLEALGCQVKAYQETKRELWTLDGVEVTIDEWPFLEPLLEIEAKDEANVRAMAEKLGFDWSSALFSSVTALYVSKYGIDWQVISNSTPRIVFDMENPFE
ncbi:CYTH domain-containing protein [Candidatus Falkowbacteria bacterium]|nr:CYTH domain-containing protein [Candidatus Falkowbacteria bacterium]